MIQKTLFLLLSTSLSVNALHSDAVFFSNKTRPLVVSHRGDSGPFPEHSQGAYAGAFFAGADYIELDFHPTKDGYLVVNHDPCLSTTTDILEYSWLYKEREVDSFQFAPDGFCTNDYLIHNFTLAELKQLKRKMRYDFRSHTQDYVYHMMTVDEVIEFTLDLNDKWPRTDRDVKVGLYIEAKIYPYYKEHGFDSAELLYQVLKKYDLETVEKSTAKLPIIFQDFEWEGLQRWAALSDLPAVYLIRQANWTNIDFDFIAMYGAGVGPDKKFLTEEWTKINNGASFIGECHKRGMYVHPWVLRNDELYFTENAIDENIWYINAQVDGLFTEFPETTFAVFEQYAQSKQGHKMFKQANHPKHIKPVGGPRH